MTGDYDAILIVSFGGPEAREDVIPFLENVLRGKNVPRQRMLEVAEHYYHFDGVSPINEQNRRLIAALESELQRHGPRLAIYWGNRNWHPLLPDTLRRMKKDGVRRSLALFTSAYSSYSGCRQYLQDIQRARGQVGEGAPEVDKLRAFFNHPGFIEPLAERVRTAINEIPAERREAAHVVYTAHSIPLTMARGCRYEEQLKETSRLVGDAIGNRGGRLVYQSRSGPPSQPWLEPDVGDYLKEVRSTGKDRDVVIAPIGFLSDHMEVLFDLDVEAKQLGQQLGLNIVRARTVGTHPRFITMIRELIEERIARSSDRPALGTLGPSHDVCPADCCPLA